MPVPSTPRVKLRTSGQARGGGMLETDAEPNMRLSRAILVMLLLHLVAVGGICAFSLIKERNPGHQTPESAVEAEDSQLPSTAVTPKADPLPPRSSVHVVRAGETLTRIANENGVSLEALVAANGAGTVTSGLHPGQELKLPARPPEPLPKSNRAPDDALALIEGSAASAEEAPAGRTSRSTPDSGKTYLVEKGDTPARIAKKLKVSADALTRLNGLDDPKKLRPGQKLRIPAAKPPARH